MIDQRVATRVGEMLASGNPQVLAQGAQIVAARPRLMNALRTISNAGSVNCSPRLARANIMAGAATVGGHLMRSAPEPSQSQRGAPEDYYDERSGGTP